MIQENLTKEEKIKFVQEFKGLLKLGDVAKELGISFSLLSQIISEDRTDTCNAIDYCITAINKKLEAIMPQQS